MVQVPTSFISNNIITRSSASVAAAATASSSNAVSDVISISYGGSNDIITKAVNETTSLLSLNDVVTKSASTSVSSVSSVSIISNLWTTYTALLETHPLIVKSITATIIISFADFIAQVIDHTLRYMSSSGTSSSSSSTTSKLNYLKFDWMRTVRFGIFGAIGTPWSHYYFTYLDKYIPPTINPYTLTTVIKVLIDQFIQAPILLAIMISSLSLMSGSGISGMKHELQSNYITSLIANWKLWLPASAINIAFVKPSLRVLYVNVIFFGWVVFLSLLLNQK